MSCGDSPESSVKSPLALTSTNCRDSLPTLKAVAVNWVAQDIRDQMVDFVRHWPKRAELSAKWMLGRIGLFPRNYHHWQERYGVSTPSVFARAVAVPGALKGARIA